MRCAARSPKPSATWQLRTSSAKAPPPGTTTTGSGDDAIASSQAASSPERTTLPPSLTTTNSLSPAAGASETCVRASGRVISKISLGADDFDADGAGLLVELLDLHHDASRARMSETVARNVLSQSLDQVDMPPGDDGFDAGDDRVVVEGAADIVVERARGRRQIDIDREADALGRALLVVMHPDFDIEHEIVDEYAVRHPHFVRAVTRRHLPQFRLGHDRGSLKRSRPPSLA